MTRRSLPVYLFFALLIVNLGIGYHVYSQEAKRTESDDVFMQIDVMMEVLQQIRKFYVDGDNISTRELIEGAMRGMTSTLDPYSEYLGNQDFENLQEETEGEFGGIGIQVDYDKDHIVVIAPIDNTPAFNAGMQPGDQIYQVDGEDVAKLGVENTIRKMRGKPGTKVVITYMREGFDEPQSLELTRALIPIESVTKAQIIPDTKIAYVRITQFMEKTPNELEENLIDLLDKQKAKALIIDLRNNPGGLVKSVVECCGYFLPPKSFVVSVEGRTETYVETTQEKRYQAPKVPIAILVNGGTASAAEIMSGCLREHGRAKLFGTKTFGKGSVQSVIDMRNGGALKLTIAHYFVQPKDVPNRKTIHKNGIEPDQAITLTQDEIRGIEAFDQEWTAAREKQDLTDTQRIKLDEEFRIKREKLDKTLNSAIKDLNEKTKEDN